MEQSNLAETSEMVYIENDKRVGADTLSIKSISGGEDLVPSDWASSFLVRIVLLKFCG